MEDRVYTTFERPFSAVQHVGIVITRIGENGNQQHVGILHKDESTNSVQVLHLAWHNTLKNSNPKPSYAWVAPPISDRRARQVAAFCRKVYRSNKSGIPYAFSPATDCFDSSSGAFLVGPGRKGLTCASFVLAVFHTTGLPLLDYGTWPNNREGDKEWQSYIVEQLEQDNASLDHIANVKSEIGLVRYRPEDVAGAGATENIPAPFEEADLLAKKIIEKLRDNKLFTAHRASVRLGEHE